jgi:hemoglobin
MNPGAENTIAAALGEARLKRLISAFYRGVAADNLLGPMYRASLAKTGESLAHAEDRLLAFMLHRLGMSDRYTRERGHPRLRARHAGFFIDPAAARRWTDVMDRAIDECRIDEPIARELRSYFAQTAAWMVNQPEPSRP